MPQGEIFAFPPRKPPPDGDVPADVVLLLRVLARQAAETGADPSAVLAADIELLMVCDTVLMLARQADQALAAWQSAKHPNHLQGREEWRRRQRAVRPALRRAAKLRSQTPVGIYAKAAAIRRVGTSAAGLAVSLADDLLNCPELRAVIWPAGDLK